MKKITFGALAITLMTTSCGRNQNQGQAAAPVQDYPTAVVQEQSTEVATVYPVTIKGKEDIEIRPRIDGFIEAIYVDEGSVVKQGQVLFRINSPQADQALTSAQAGLSAAKAQVNTAKVNVNRIKPLADKGIVSKVQLETAEDSYQSALASLEQAQAALKNARATKGWTTVTSPVNGLVGEIPFRIGSLVSSSNVLTTVANTSNVFAYFSINEKELETFLNNAKGRTQAEKIKNMSAVNLTLADGTLYPYPGKIETITGSVNISTGSVSLRAQFPNKEGKLRSGTSGKISIPQRLDHVFVIPQAATFSLQDKVLVYKVQKDSVVREIVSVVSMPNGKDYAVTSGLSGRDRIVVDGVPTLYEGKKIAFKQ
jgi:membrane fusion protein, multidrug efflux system